MPAAVQKYLDTNNLRDVANLQRDIVQLYRRDISKYDPDRKLQIDEFYVGLEDTTRKLYTNAYEMAKMQSEATGTYALQQREQLAGATCSVVRN